MKSAVSALALLAGLAVTSPAAVVYSNLGPGDTFDTLSPYALGGSSEQQVAVSFVPVFDSTLVQLRFAVSHATGTNAYTVIVAADNAGEPGSAIETLTPQSLPASPDIVNLFSVSNPPLLAGTTYWLVLSAVDPSLTTGNSYRNDQGQNGFLFRTPLINSNAWTFSTLATPAFEVIDAIPEPSTAILGIAGLAAIFGTRRRRRSS